MFYNTVQHMHFSGKIISLHKVFTFLLLFTMPLYATSLWAGIQEDQQFYQLKIYHVKDIDQKKQLENFLEDAYLPALHRAGISKVGVFYPASSDDDKINDSLLYVLIPFVSLQQFATLEETLSQDNKFMRDGKDYLEAASDNPPYTRFESILMQAFSGMPTLKAPDLESKKSEAIYELRSYEAATELLHLNKVKMFNDGEIDIFERLGFNAVFYARVIAGSKLPNLMYMTSFENMDSRDAHWKTFVDDQGWKKLSSDPQYQKNVSDSDIYLLHASPYSDI